MKISELVEDIDAVVLEIQSMSKAELEDQLKECKNSNFAKTIDSLIDFSRSEY